MQINPRTFADATQLADNIYELILTNWGNRGLAQDADNGSISYPTLETLPNGSIPIIGPFKLPLIPSLTAIAIAPRSTVDRCIINYSTLPQSPKLDTLPEGFVNQGNILDTEQILSVHSPLIGSQLGPIIIRAHETSYFSDSYVPVDQTILTTRPFGTAVPPNVSGAPVWSNPELRLLLYMNGKAALPPTKRAPFHFATATYTFTTNPLAEELLAVVPFAGRRYARVNFKSGAGDITLRLTGAQWNGQPAGGPTFVTNRNIEYPLASTINIVAPNSVSPIVENPGVSFLMVKATTTLLLDTVRFTVDVFD